MMLYNRRALCTFKHWIKYALLKGKPWKTFRWTLWHHMESIGTKGYTQAEVLQMLSPLGLKGIRMQNFVTSWDRKLLENRSVPIADHLLQFAVNVTGTRLGFFCGIIAQKL